MKALLRTFPRDAAAIIGLVLLWAFYFWRLLTPVEGDQASLKLGDFSGQFVAFAGYQYERFAAGEVPLWNPYNNGGLPFIADTQAAVFYPPRLLTIAAARLGGGWTYHALELEMIAHVLLFTLLVYALIRRLTREQHGSWIGSLSAAIIAGYSGFMTGYAPLQLAILEAATWTPLALLGIVLATEQKRVRPLMFAVTGAALGLSWLAGHPQTSYFLTYLLIAYTGWRIYQIRAPFIQWVIGCAIFGVLSFGLAAVQLLPGFEYLGQTARVGFEYDAKGNGFPFQDLAQFLYPEVVSLFSPLYVGFFGLVLGLIAVLRRLGEYRFWALVAVFALLWSFGANSPLYPLLYNLMPGLRFFRGQERAAFLVMISLVILAGTGMVSLVGWRFARDYMGTRRLRRALVWVLIASAIVAVLTFIFWLGMPDLLADAMPKIAYSTLIIGAAAVLIPLMVARARRPEYFLVIVAALTFELFTVTMTDDATYDPVPPTRQISMTAPDVLQTVLDDTDQPFRVDGFRGVHDNYGSLYGIQDMRGISPLFLDDAFAIVEGDVQVERAWEVFAVRYVFSDWQELPVPSRIVDQGVDRYGPTNVHRLESPRPFAQVMYDAWIAADEADAVRVLSDPAVDVRRIVVLTSPPDIPLDASRTPVEAEITEFLPERVTINASTPVDGILSIAMVHYPGWNITIDGQPADSMSAYGALTAVVLPAGDHVVQMTYDPVSYRAGAILSLAALGVLCILAVLVVLKRTR